MKYVEYFNDCELFVLVDFVALSDFAIIIMNDVDFVQHKFVEALWHFIKFVHDVADELFFDDESYFDDMLFVKNIYFDGKLDSDFDNSKHDFIFDKQ